MSTTKTMTNDLIKARCVEMVACRGHYTGDLNNAPTGEFTVRADSGSLNLPVNKNGHLSSVLYSNGSSKQEFYTTDGSYRVFVRTRWYSNNWLNWMEFQPIRTISEAGGGKSLPFNHLRNLAERRVA